MFLSCKGEKAHPALETKAAVTKVELKDSIISDIQMIEKPIKCEVLSTPQCILAIIDSIKSDPVRNPPRKVIRYSCQGKQFYYIKAICCDYFSILYDSDCHFVGYPDGGILGDGDTSLQRILKECNENKVIFLDNRKYKD